MKRKITKFVALCSALTLMVGATAMAALPNKYGVSYSKTEQGGLCTMVAKGTSSAAKTTVTNDRAANKYLSCGVVKRYADSNVVIETKNKADSVAPGAKIVTSVSRSWKTTNREFKHIAESWDCSGKPSGSGVTAYHRDVLSYTIKQAN